MAELDKYLQSWTAFSINITTSSQHLRRWFRKLRDPSPSLTQIDIAGEVFTLRFDKWGEDHDDSGNFLHCCTWSLIPNEDSGELSRSERSSRTGVGLWIDFSDITPNLVHVSCWCDGRFPAVVETAKYIYSRIDTFLPVEKKIGGELIEEITSTSEEWNKLLPTQPETIQKWNEAWNIMKELQRTYYELFEDGHTEESSPNWQDYADALRKAKIWNKGPGRRNIERILKAGKAGCLS